MKRYTGILLDFDYTLADSSAGVYDCVNYGLEAIGCPSVAKSRSDRTIGLSLKDTLRELTGITQGAGRDIRQILRGTGGPGDGG